MNATPERVTLTEDERERLETSLRWHFNVVAEEGKGSAYASTGVMNAVNIVERILSDRLRAAQADAWDQGYEAAEDDARAEVAIGIFYKTANLYRETP